MSARAILAALLLGGTAFAQQPASRPTAAGAQASAAAPAASAASAAVMAPAAAAAATAASGATFYDPARGRVPLLAEAHPPRLTNWVNDDERRPRGWRMQPPTIPHRVDGYQVDRYFNKCLDCHARDRTELTNAIPVSPTHYVNRGGTVLPTISTRRYFCMQCHVAQEPAKPLVRNDFQGVDALQRRAAGTTGAAAQPK